MNNNTKMVLPVIVIAQFLCTSLWFAGNAIIPDLAIEFNLDRPALGHITSAVQSGFITGTFVYAFFLIADRFKASSVFLVSALLGAVSNLGMLTGEQSISSLMVFRFLTGFFLAGIYPVGMKIASDHFEKGLGRALGFLVGALVVGTAFPHLLKSLTTSLSWKTVLILTALLSVCGGLLMKLFVPEGRYQKRAQALQLNALFRVFRNPEFRSAAMGYFGHMWELYTFWAFVPVMIVTYKNLHPGTGLPVSSWSFWIIALGGLACVAGGYLSVKSGAKKIASSALLLSGCCCLVSPIAFQFPVVIFLAFLIFWGLVVIADSPLFSTLVALNAIPEIKGTALTTVTCIGFSITIASIELMNYLATVLNQSVIFMFLAIGPVTGLFFMFSGRKQTNAGQQS